MSEAKHTPGPWAFEAVQRFPFGVCVTAATDKIIISQAAYAFSSSQKTRRDCEDGIGFDGPEIPEVVAAIKEQDANARLIAAAPDLLLALKLARGHVWATNEAEHMMDGFGPRQERPSDLELDAIDRAIAKAEGGDAIIAD